MPSLWRKYRRNCIKREKLIAYWCWENITPCSLPMSRGNALNWEPDLVSENWSYYQDLFSNPFHYGVSKMSCFTEIKPTEMCRLNSRGCGVQTCFAPLVKKKQNKTKKRNQERKWKRWGGLCYEELFHGSNIHPLEEGHAVLLGILSKEVDVHCALLSLFLGLIANSPKQCNCIVVAMLLEGEVRPQSRAAEDTHLNWFGVGLVLDPPFMLLL